MATIIGGNPVEEDDKDGPRRGDRDAAESE